MKILESILEVLYVFRFKVSILTIVLDIRRNFDFNSDCYGLKALLRSAPKDPKFKERKSIQFENVVEDNFDRPFIR